MFASLWIVLRGARWWRAVSGGIGALADWLGASTLHAVLAVLVVSLAGNGWQWHARHAEAARSARVIGQWRGAFAAEQAVRAQAVGQADSLRQAVAGQNRAVAAMARAGAARMVAGRQAVAGLAGGERAMAEAAGRIHQELGAVAVEAGAVACRTPDSVMAARGLL